MSEWFKWRNILKCAQQSKHHTNQYQFNVDVNISRINDIKLISNLLSYNTNFFMAENTFQRIN